jgi:hypothetical protein
MTVKFGASLRGQFAVNLHHRCKLKEFRSRVTPDVRSQFRYRRCVRIHRVLPFIEQAFSNLANHRVTPSAHFDRYSGNHFTPAAQTPEKVCVHRWHQIPSFKNKDDETIDVDVWGSREDKISSVWRGVVIGD